jgi:hypothetical protein
MTASMSHKTLIYTKSRTGIKADYDYDMDLTSRHLASDEPAAQWVPTSQTPAQVPAVTRRVDESGEGAAG